MTLLRGDPTVPLIVTAVERSPAAMRNGLWSCLVARPIDPRHRSSAPESADHRCARRSPGRG
jgi:hypothetical protein